jgi:tetratricopeptide (TPR) repeat protein
LEEAVRLIDLLRGMDPQHPTIASDAATLQGKLARLERETGNLDKAIEEASIAVDRVLEFAALDKSNLNAQSMVGNIYDVQYEAFLHSGRLEEAAQATRKGFDAHASVLSKSPGSFRHIVLAGESAAKLGDAYLRNRQYSEALKWLERSSEILEQYRNLPAPLPAQAEAVAKGYAEYLEAVRFATDRSIATPALEDPQVERLFALSMRAYVDALEGSNAELDKDLDTCSEWMKSIDDVSESAVVLIDRSQLIMIRALLVASLSQPNQDLQDPASYRSRALAMARKVVANKPGLIEAYLAEPDMAAIRDHLKNAPEDSD